MKRMKRAMLLPILFLLTGKVFCQPPAGYYDSAEGLTGESLKTALYELIDDHIEFPYSSSGTDTWDILKESDRDPENPSNVILFYTGWSVNAAQEYNNGNGWNREHVWAKSRGDFGTSPGPGTDCHHLRPSDISVNAARENRWFDYADDPYYEGGVFTGCYLGTQIYVWEPRDEVKGDVARIILYMDTRYEGENGEPDLEVIDYLPSNNYTNEPVHAKLSTLLEWHYDDPVSDFERNRNNVVYSYQQNRNPFIDHPEYVGGIWGFPEAIHEESLEVNVYPNPATQYLFVNSPVNMNLTLFSTDGRMLKKVYSTQMKVSEFNPGMYFLRVTDDKGTFAVVRVVIGKN